MSFLDDVRKEKTFDINSSIYFDDILDDSIVKSIKNKFIKIYKIHDINYLLSDKEEKEDILVKYMNFFNNLNYNYGITFILNNRKNNNDYHLPLKDEDDGFNILRSSLNEVIDDNIYKAGENYVKEKYICIDIEDKEDENAIKRFRTLDDVLKRNLYEIQEARMGSLKYDDIVRFYFDLYNPFSEDEFKYYKEIYSKENIKESGLHIKNYIKPKSMYVANNYIKLNDKYIRLLYSISINKQIDANTIDMLLNQEYEMSLGIKIKQIENNKAIRMAKLELGNVEGEIYDIQSKFAKEGVSTDLIPRALKQRREEAIHINDSLMRHDENLFDISIYTLIKAESMEELNDNTYKFLNNARMKGINFKIGIEMQEKIFNSIIPYGLNQTPYVVALDTESLCGLNIFKAVDVIQENGDYYGKNILTNNPIIYNMMSGDNYSVLIFGMAGKGKSFLAKKIETQKMISDDQRDLVWIDPNNENRGLILKLGGRVIDIKADGDTHINLFDIDETYGDNNPIAEKEDFILSICSLMLRHELTAGQRTTISVAVSRVYSKWNETHCRDDIPTIEDFANELKNIIIGGENNATSASDVISSESDSQLKYKQGFANNEDIELLKAIMYYSETSHCTIFRGKSDISINNRIICFNLQQLGKDLKPLAMEVLLDNIWLRICRNRELRRPTDVVIDEFHLMFQLEGTRVWMANYWKMLRKYLGCPIGITQNPEDVLSITEGRTVIANTGLSMILSLNESDRKLAKKEFNLSDEETEYIKNRKSGEGIIIFDTGKMIKKKVVIPFTDEYRKTNALYKLINTSYDAE